MLVPLFVEQHHRARGNRSADEAGRTLSFDLAKRWPHRSVKEITGPELTRLLRDVAVGRKAPGQARRLYIALSRFFRWCVAEGYCASSPVSTVEAPPPDRVRERVISDLEIALMWRSAHTLGYPFGYCIQLLILTGRVETKSLKRNAPNSISRPRNHPSGHAVEKASAPTFVIYHLRRSPSSRPCRKSAIRFCHLPFRGTGRVGRDAVVAGDLLFCTTVPTPISGFSKVRNRLQELMVEEAKRLDLPLPDDDWQFHDLRRSIGDVARCHWICCARGRQTARSCLRRDPGCGRWGSATRIPPRTEGRNAGVGAARRRRRGEPAPLSPMWCGSAAQAALDAQTRDLRMCAPVLMTGRLNRTAQMG